MVTMSELDDTFPDVTRPYVFGDVSDVEDYRADDYHDDGMTTSGLIPTEISPDVSTTDSALGEIAVEGAVQHQEDRNGPNDRSDNKPEGEYVLPPFNPEGRFFGPHEARKKIKEVYGLIWDKMNVADALTSHDLKYIAVMLSDTSDAEACELYGFNRPGQFSRKASLMLGRLAANRQVHGLVPEHLLHPEGPIPKWRSEVNFASSQIAAVRNERGLTQDEAAQLVGVSIASIHRLEHGDAYPAPEQVEQYMRAWGVDNDRMDEVLEIYAAARERRFANPDADGSLSEETTSGKREFLKGLAESGTDVAGLLPPKARALRKAAPLIIEGLSGKEIAVRLGVSEQSAHRYVGDIVRSLARHVDLVSPELLESPQTIQPVEGVGRVLRQLRQTLGVGVSEMREALGGSKYRLFRFEKGENRPGRWFVERYLAYIEVSPDVAEAILAAYDEEVRRNDKRYKRDNDKQ
jgi:transcriptional regulator with XRE-family HTH domain